VAAGHGDELRSGDVACQPLTVSERGLVLAGDQDAGGCRHVSDVESPGLHEGAVVVNDTARSRCQRFADCLHQHAADPIGHSFGRLAGAESVEPGHQARHHVLHHRLFALLDPGPFLPVLGRHAREEVKAGHPGRAQADHRGAPPHPIRMARRDRQRVRAATGDAAHAELSQPQLVGNAHHVGRRVRHLAPGQLR
jgi:hypothetical protein